MIKPALCLAALLATSAGAQDWAAQSLSRSPRHGEWVKIQAGKRTIDAFVAYPEVKNKAPSVVVIHEIFGLTDWARDLADQVAAAGAIAVAPDLLSGKGPNGGGTADFKDVDASRKAVSQLDPAEVTAALDAAADYAKSLPAANGKLAVAGFCWGGGQSFRFAAHRPDLKAAFVFYGPPPEELKSIVANIYGFYGGQDARITATVPDTTQRMKAAGKTYEPVIYDGAGHGFMRSGEDPSGQKADRKAREKAWKRWRALLRKL